MPEFIMNGKTETEFKALPEVVQGFIEAMFFTETCNGADSDEWFTPENQEGLTEGTIDGCLPSDKGFSDLNATSLQNIIDYCAQFELQAAALLQPIIDDEIDGYDMNRVGNDLWYTSNGHGVGFWSRDELEENKIGEKLSKLCRYNEFNAYYGEDEKIYLD